MQETFHACTSLLAVELKWSPALQFHRSLRSTRKGMRASQIFLSQLLLHSQKCMPSFISDQESHLSHYRRLSTSLLQPQSLMLTSKPKTLVTDLERHGSHEPLTRGKVFWICEVEETAVNECVKAPGRTGTLLLTHRKTLHLPRGASGPREQRCCASAAGKQRESKYKVCRLQSH